MLQLRLRDTFTTAYRLFRSGHETATASGCGRETVFPVEKLLEKSLRL